MKISFTLRDWLWFCVVMALAIGWGLHVRYTNHVEMVSTNEFMQIELTGQLREALRIAKDEVETRRALVTSMKKHLDHPSVAMKEANLTAEQSEMIHKSMVTCGSQY